MDLLNRTRPTHWLILAALLAAAEPALAYVGPGAGIAIGTTIATLFVAGISAIGTLFFWPIRFVIRSIRNRAAHRRAKVRRVVVLGLDGLEHRLLERYVAEGKLPNIKRLIEQGSYRKLRTTAPAMTPVAWSSFLTGCNPGKHNIFDFLTRDKRTYLPMLSSVHVGPPRKVLKLGRYRIPLGPPEVRLLRKGVPFWNILADHGIFSNIVRMPITFPPEKFGGVLLSAMCVPDLRGSQGTFSYYSSNGDQLADQTGGEQLRVEVRNGVVKAHLVGPPNSLVEKGDTLTCPFELRVQNADTAVLKIAGQTFKLKRGEYSPWVRVKFNAAMGLGARGICQFLLLEAQPHVRLYVTPIQIDPASPALPISHPQAYAVYLSKLIGTYATLGLAEDTWGLNAKVLDDEAFVQQVDQVDDERIKMFFDALDKVRRGLVACVVDGPDRIHHMFWRYLDPQHPAHGGQGGRERRDAVEAMYRRMDQLVGDTLKRCQDEHTLLVVMSDHGCASFRRGVDLNYWLEQNGYLKLKEGGRGQKYLTGVDWSQTRAYAIGLTGLWLNIKGREAHGIVEPGDAAALRREIAGKLAGLRDPQHDTVAINRALAAVEVYRGPYAEGAPDLIVGYNEGYRVSWEAALGQPTDALFHDNVKAWSGDHIIDPALVPGILLCNRKIADEAPHITDLAPTVLDHFGVPIPKHMDGRPLAIGG